MNLTKPYFVAWVTALLTLWLAPGWAEPAATPTIQWYSYQDGIAKIKKENKKGFLHFYTDWCTFCKLMNANTFTDKKIIANLNENFVPILVNAEKDRDVAKNYNANKFPYTVFIAEDTSTIGSRPGYVPPDLLQDMLAYVLTNTYKNMTFNEYMEKKQAQQNEPPPEPKM